MATILIYTTKLGQFIVTAKSLKTLRNHLGSRNLNSYHYKLTIDPEGNVITFYLFNLSGKIVGYQQYRPDADKTKRNNPKDGRYYTHITKGELAVWGLETFNYKPNVLFITEGIFDACRIHNFGYPAIAVLTSNPKPLKNWLNSINRTIIGVCDPGPSGKYMKRYCDVFHTMSDIDLGDTPEMDVFYILENLLNEVENCK